MHAATVSTLLVIALALAGCSSGDGDAPTAEDAGPPTLEDGSIDCEALLAEHAQETEEDHAAEGEDETLPDECEELFMPIEAGPPFPLQMEAWDCHGVQAVFYIPAAVLDTAGFPMQPDYSGPGGTGIYTSGWATCGDIIIHGQSQGRADFFLDGVYVDPPSEYESDGVDAYILAFDQHSTGDEVVQTILDWGIFAQESAISWSLSASPAGTYGQLSSNQGTYTNSLYLTTSAGAPFSNSDPIAVRWLGWPDDDGFSPYYDFVIAGSLAGTQGGAKHLFPQNPQGDPTFLAIGHAVTQGLVAEFTWSDDEAPDIVMTAGNWQDALAKGTATETAA